MCYFKYINQEFINFKLDKCIKQKTENTEKINIWIENVNVINSVVHMTFQASNLLVISCTWYKIIEYEVMIMIMI